MRVLIGYKAFSAAVLRAKQCPSADIDVSLASCTQGPSERVCGTSRSAISFAVLHVGRCGSIRLAVKIKRRSYIPEQFGPTHSGGG